MGCRSQPTGSLALAEDGHGHGALSAECRCEILSLSSLAVWSQCPVCFTGMGGLWFYMSVLQKDVVF